MKVRKGFLYALLLVAIIAVAVLFYADRFFVVKSTEIPEVVIQNVQEDEAVEDEAGVEKLTYGYSLKGDKVYYQGQEISDADATTFETIGEYIGDLQPAIDQYFYYEKGVMVSEKGSDYFKMYDDKYFKRGLEVYGYYDQLLEIHIGPIQGADPKTFVPIGGYYSKDKDDVFYYEKGLDGAEPASFSVIKSTISGIGLYYGKDNKSVYFEEARLLDADPNTFYIKTIKVNDKVNFGFGADAEHLYNYGTLLIGIDPNKAYIQNGGGVIRDDDTKWYRKKTDCYELPNLYIPENEIPEAERATWVGGGC